MANVKLPKNGKVIPSHKAHGSYAVSDAHGLVLVGKWPRSIAGEMIHALELPLVPKPAVVHWPVRAPNGFNTEPDQVIPLGVDRVVIEALTNPKAGQANETVPGDLFIDSSGTHAVGKRLASGSANMFDLDTHEGHSKEFGAGIIVKHWRLSGYRGEDLVFQVEIGTP